MKSLKCLLLLTAVGALALTGCVDVHHDDDHHYDHDHPPFHDDHPDHHDDWHPDHP